MGQPTSTHLARARALLDLGRADDAIKALHEAIASDPEDMVLYCELGRALLARRDAGDLERAVDAANRAAAIDPMSEWPHRIASIALGANRQRRDAVVAAAEAVRRNPNDAARRQLSNALADGNWLVQAAEVSEQLVAEHPASPHALLGLAHIRLRQVRPDLAEPLIRSALAISPTDPEGVRLAGLLATMQGRTGDGAATLVRSQKLDLGASRARVTLQHTSGRIFAADGPTMAVVLALGLFTVRVLPTAGGPVECRRCFQGSASLGVSLEGAENPAEMDAAERSEPDVSCGLRFHDSELQRRGAGLVVSRLALCASEDREPVGLGLEEAEAA